MVANASFPPNWKLPLHVEVVTKVLVNLVTCPKRRTNQRVHTPYVDDEAEVGKEDDK